MRLMFWVVGAAVILLGYFVYRMLRSSPGEAPAAVPVEPVSNADEASAVALEPAINTAPPPSDAVETAAAAGTGVAVAGGILDAVVEDSDVVETAADAVGSIFDLFT